MLCKTANLGGPTKAALDCYVLDPEISTGKRMKRPAMLVLPGGAYLKQAHREGEVVAARFLGMGYSAFILRYSVYVKGIDKTGRPLPNPASHYPVQVVEAMRAMQWLHAHADELWIDASHIFAVGFSAGAHILCSMCERYDDPELLAQVGDGLTSSRQGTEKPATTRPDSAEKSGAKQPYELDPRNNLPAGQILAYPMITASVLLNRAKDSSELDLLSRAIMGRTSFSPDEINKLDVSRGVRPELPPTFIWQTATDETVDPQETLRLVSALMTEGVPCELHLYESGPHGMALADATSCAREGLADPRVATWTKLAASWLETHCR